MPILNGLRARSVSIAITDKDRRHMDAVSSAERLRIMQRIMRGPPAEERRFRGNTNYVKAMLTLRAGGLRLIDLQRHETSFASVWYRRGASVLGLPLSESVALLVWEVDEHNDEVTTLKTWRR
jgi:hypothetical protein